MDEFQQLMAAAAEQGFTLELDGDRLQVECPIEEFDFDLLDRLHASETGIVAALRQAAMGHDARARACRPSFAQQRLWLIDRLHGGSQQYNMPVAVHLRGVLDEACVQRAFDLIVARHEALRTRFVQEAGELVALVEPARPVVVRRLALRAGDDLEPVIAAEAVQAFDLEHGPMVRATLVRIATESAAAPDEHLLLVTLHHIAADGWSVGVFVREFGTLYAALRRGTSPQLPKPGMQYPDYANWQRERLHKPELQQQVDYWRDTLQGMPALHTLPLDRPRPVQPGSEGGVHVLKLDAVLRTRLAALAQSRESTLFTVLHAAFAALLHRYGGEEEVVVGIPVAGRSHHELEDVIGMFVNTLVLRSKVQLDMTFEELLAQGRKVVLGALEHPDMPFEMLVDEISPDRSLSYMPLCQILFSMQERHMDRLTLPELDVKILEGAFRRVKFDLETEVVLHADGMDICWRYASALFDGATIERWAMAYVELLHALADAPEQPLRQLLGLPAADARLLAAWNDTDQDFPVDDTLAGMVEAQALRTPDACALVTDDASLSYAELDRRANGLAHQLAEQHGVGPGMRVGLCIGRSAEMVVAILAIMKAGAAYVALDAALPADRLAYMLTDSGATVVLTGRDEATALTPQPGVACLLVERATGVDAPARRSGDGPRADGLAYVIYTSGSTGRPKGTLNLHRGPCNRIHAMQRQFPLTRDDRVLQKTPLTFDVSVWEIFWPLSVGATLVLARPEGHKDPDYLAATVQRHGVTVLHFVPSMLQMFLRGAARGPFPTLRYLMTSGEALSTDLQAQCIASFPGVELINHYGPTETGIEVSWWRFNEVRADKLVPIGAPLANVRLYILDADDAPVPVGVTGELHIAGIQVGEGYLNRPELTAERFVERTVLGRTERLYRTGDLARWLGDGQIAYVGRLDNQIKLFGVRIELGEIESQLRALELVEDAVVTVHGDHAAQRLVCYVVPAGPVEAEAEFVATLKTELVRFLPGYVLQASVFMVVTNLPLSQNGKVDRQALPLPRQAVEPARIVNQPDSQLAKALRGVWAQQLGIPAEQISIHDDFFDIGGNSLLTIAVQAEMRTQLQLDIEIADIFRNPTIAQLCRHVAQTAAPVPAVAQAPAPVASGATQSRSRILQARTRSLPSN